MTNAVQFERGAVTDHAGKLCCLKARAQRTQTQYHNGKDTVEAVSAQR